MVYKNKKSSNRKNKRSQKRVRFGGATYVDPELKIDCQEESCKIKIENEIIGLPIKGNQSELEQLINEQKNNLSDDLKKRLGLTIDRIYELAKCTIEEYTSNEEPVETIIVGNNAIKINTVVNLT